MKIGESIRCDNEIHGKIGWRIKYDPLNNPSNPYMVFYEGTCINSFPSLLAAKKRYNLENAKWK